MAVTIHVLAAVYFLLCGVIVCWSTVSTTRQRQSASSTVSGTTSLFTTGEFDGYIPTTPSSENVNCYIEVPTLQTVGGRCVRFGRSRIWSCQSGIHIQMSGDCERLSRRNDQNRRRTRSPRS